MRISPSFLLSVTRSGRHWCGTVGHDGRGRARDRQQSPERGLEQRERIALPPRDTITYRGGTVGILNTLWGDCPVLATVQVYSCRTADNSIPLITSDFDLAGLGLFVADSS